MKHYFNKEAFVEGLSCLFFAFALFIWSIQKNIFYL